MTHRRIFDDVKKARLLEALGTCRSACTDSMRHMPVNGEVYKGTEDVTAAIDELAEILTGDRQYFWLKRHSC